MKKIIFANQKGGVGKTTTCREIGIYFGSIGKVKRNYNPDINIAAVIINAFDSRPIITREIKEEIEEVFGDKVIKTVLSKTVKIEEAISEKKGVIDLKILDKSRIKEEVTLIGNELLRRLGG